MSRISKKSDLEKDDLKKFSISLTEARKANYTKDDIKGIKEIIPNEKYEIRLTTKPRIYEVVYGTLHDTIARKKKIIKENSIKIINEFSDIDFYDLVQLFVTDLHKRRKKGKIDINTIYDYVKDLEGDAIPFFSKYKIKDITSEVIEAFVEYLYSRPKKNGQSGNLSERTIEKILTSVGAVFTFATKHKPQILATNPVKGIDNKPDSSKKRKELPIFKLADAQYALKCIDKYANIRLKTFMHLVFSLGCRREEACGLRWCDIDFTTGEVNYNDAVTSSTPKRYLEEGEERIRTKKLKTHNSYRTNFLPEKVLRFLKQYYEFQISSGYLIEETDQIFRNLRNTKMADPNKLSEEWRKFKKQYNIKDVDLHRIRHTVANILEKQNVPKKDIAVLLGNTERVLEKYYTHVDYEDLMNMRSKLNDTLFEDDGYVTINIDLVVSILNNYPLSSLLSKDLELLDKISDINITLDNYDFCLSNCRQTLLQSYPDFSFFIDNDPTRLQTKINTYKNFQKQEIKVKSLKDLINYEDILSL